MGDAHEGRTVAPVMQDYFVQTEIESAFTVSLFCPPFQQVIMPARSADLLLSGVSAIALLC